MKGTFVLILCFFLTNGCFSQDLNAGLVAYYKLDGNALDAGPNGLNGTITNVSGTTNSLGVANTAMSFSNALGPTNPAATSWITLPASASLQLLGDKSFSFWMKPNPDAPADGYNEQLYASGFCGDYLIYAAYLSGQLYSENGCGGNSYTTTYGYPAGVWQHIVVTESTGGQMKFYKNGALVGSGPNQSTNISYSGTTYIGRYQSTGLGALAYRGDLDQFRIYNRVLTQAEINLLSSENSPSPTISSFSPGSGPVGTSVTITGTNFNPTASNNVVFFGATKAVVTAASSNSLTVTVPAGTTYENITVTNLGSNLTANSSKPFIVTLAGGTAFATKQDKATASEPYETCISDIDGDGKPDIAVVNNSSNSVSVLRNVSLPGTVSVSAKVDFTTGTNPQYVTAADIDGDGKPDLVIANNGSSTVSVLRNTSIVGTIGFAAKTDLSTGVSAGPGYVRIGDIDADGKPDIIVTNGNTNTLSVFRNTSTVGVISFATRIDLTTGAFPNGLSINDIDGDGKPDLSITNFSGASFSVFRNTSVSGTISFAAKVDFTTGTQPFSISTGDIDGDGKADVVITDGNLSVFRNTSVLGTISFAAKVSFAAGGSAYGTAIADIDGNGKPDIAMGIPNVSSKVAVFPNISTTGTISFGTRTDLITGGYTNFVSVADIDGDTKPDVVANNSGSNTISILQQLPPAPTISSFSPATGPPGTLVTVTGTNFNNITTVSIGGATAIVISNTASQVVGMVMPGAVTGAVSITTGSGTVNGAGNFTVTATPYPGIQQGNKLLASDVTGSANQGFAVALSADGNTAIAGGPFDNSSSGGAWIYTRTGGVWTQQGNKLTGTGAIGAAWQGSAVALSADGNTAVVGAELDNNLVGAAWIYTRTGGVWLQQGNKLVGTGSTGQAIQGYAVSISADGNTVLIGGNNDNNGAGATWVFTRTGGVWTQQGSKLLGSGATGSAAQGTAVSISSDGNTALIGGSNDNSGVGALWVFTRTGGVWTQQGSKLTGSGSVGNSQQGTAVSIAADGNTAVSGGFTDNGSIGATWIFVRSAGVWSQQGAKLIGTGATGNATQGRAVAVSADGNTVMTGGYNDNSLRGAAWVFTRSGGIWSQQGTKIVGTGVVGQSYQGTAVAISSDGSTGIMGGANDNSGTGAAWIFVPCTSVSIGSATAAANPICPSATTTLTASGITGNNAVLHWWTGPAGTGTDLGTANPLTNISPGTYYARVTGDCGAAEIPVTVNSFSNPAPVFTGLPSNICATAAPVTLTGSPPGGTFSGPGTSGNSFDPAVAGAGGPYTITYTYTNVNGCTNTTTQTITVKPSVPALLTAASHCTGVAITATTTQSATSLVWNLNGNPVQTVTPGWNTNATTVAGGNGQGSASNQLNAPNDVFVDASGNVFVSDFINHRIQKWLPGATTGVTVAGGNGQGAAANQFNFPASIYVDASGNLYVSDASNNRVQKWAPGATSGTTVAGGNGAGSQNNQLNNPSGIFVDGSGNVFVSDMNNYRVQKWTPGATSGITVAGGNGQGAAANQLDHSGGLWVDSNNNIYMADIYNNRVQKWLPGAVSGITVAGGNGSGNAANQFVFPQDIFLDAVGNIFIADFGNARIQKWTEGGSSGVTVAGGTAGNAANQLSAPNGLYIDADRNLFVADFNNNRIQKFVYPGTFTRTAATAGSYTVSTTSLNGCVATSQPFVIASPPVVSPINGSTVVCTSIPVQLINSTPGGIWSSTNGSLATVDANGLVTGQAVGNVTINYTVTNTCSATTVSLPVTVSTCIVTLNLKLFLEGFYRGNSSMSSTMFDLSMSTDPTATDEIAVNLWSPAHTDINLYPTPDFTVNAILHTDGTAVMQFPPAVYGKSFFIAVKHRGSIETWSKLPVSLGSNTNYDFSTGLAKAYDDGVNPPMQLVSSGIYALYSGDVNQDGAVDASDMGDVDNDNSAFAFGYNSTDVSGDGATDASDMAIVDNNSQLFLFFARPY